MQLVLGITSCAKILPRNGDAISEEIDKSVIIVEKYFKAVKQYRSRTDGFKVLLFWTRMNSWLCSNWGLLLLFSSLLFYFFGHVPSPKLDSKNKTTLGQLKLLFKFSVRGNFTII